VEHVSFYASKKGLDFHFQKLVHVHITLSLDKLNGILHFHGFSMDMRFKLLEIWIMK
jgi:hypothetical protein